MSPRDSLPPPVDALEGATRPRPLQVVGAYGLTIAAVAAIRHALPDALLYADANRGWTPDQAMLAGDALVGLGVEAIEEPIAIEDLRGRRLLAEADGADLHVEATMLDAARRAVELAGVSA